MDYSYGPVRLHLSRSLLNSGLTPTLYQYNILSDSAHPHAENVPSLSFEVTLVTFALHFRLRAAVVMCRGSVQCRVLLPYRFFYDQRSGIPEM